MGKETITLKNGDWRIIRMTFNYLRTMKLPAKVQIKVISIQKAILRVAEPFEEAVKPLYDQHAQKDSTGIKTENGRVIWKSAEDEEQFNTEYNPVANQESSVEIDSSWKLSIDDLKDITFTGDALELMMPFIEA